MRRLTLVLLLALVLAEPAAGQIVVSGGGGSGAFADSARAASIADSAKAVRVAGSVISADAIAQNTAGKDTIGFWSNLKVRPWQKLMRVRNGYSDYAYTSSGTGTPSSKDDYAYFAYFRSSDWDGYLKIATFGSQALFAKSDHIECKLSFSGGSYTWKSVSTSFDTTAFHSLFVLVEHGDKIRAYVDGLYQNYSDITSYADSTWLTSSSVYVGNISQQANGWLGVARLFNFGTNGAPSDPDAFASALARRPLATMTELGYPEYDDADWTNQENNGDFETGDLASWSDYNTPTTSEVVTTTVHGGSYAAHVVGDASLDGIVNTSASSTDATKYYEVSAWVYVVSGVAKITDNRYSVSDSPGATSTTTGQWERLSYIQKNSASIYVYAYCSGGAAEFYLDDVEIHEIGEVARWDFNDASSSTVFADKTSNDNDLAPYKSGSPTTAGNLQETAWLNHGFFAKAGIDTVVADTAFIWSQHSSRYYFDDRDSLGPGTTTPALYSYNGEIYAHDSGGHNTKISPHWNDDWVFQSWNMNTGVRTFINMYDLVAVLEKLSGKKLMYQDTVAVQIPAEQAVDTVYVTVVDTVKHLTSKVRVLRPRPHVINVGGKWYRIDAAKISRPPAAYLKAIGVKPW